MKLQEESQVAGLLSLDGVAKNETSNAKIWDAEANEVSFLNDPARLGAGLSCREGIIQMRSRSTGLLRWLRFNTVGLMGVVVQITTLFCLRSLLKIHYLPATALAVEAAILHNFLWHERWTWSQATQPIRPGVWGRLLRFNLTVGTVSILQNLFLMKLLVAELGLHYLLASLLAITTCSLLNYFFSDWFVFRWSQTASRQPESYPGGCQ